MGPNQKWTWPDWVVLKPDDLDELTDILRQNEQPVWPNSRRFRDCFRQLGKATKSDQGGSSASQILVYLNLLLLQLLQAHPVLLVQLLLVQSGPLLLAAGKSMDGHSMQYS